MIYSYQAVLKRFVVASSAPSGGRCIRVRVPVGHEVKSGSVEAKNWFEARALAQEELRRRYPIAQGYSEHQKVVVRSQEPEPGRRTITIHRTRDPHKIKCWRRRG